MALVRDADVRQEALPEYTHVAFSVSSQDFGPLSERIKRSGAEIWQENRTEGASLYFVDPNGHKLEIHASDLTARLRAARQESWPGLEILA